MVVHDFENEDTTEQGCNIDAIFEKGNTVVFFPDSIDEAHIQGNANCEKCLGKRSVHFHTKLIIEE